MKRFRYVEPDENNNPVKIVVTEQEIIDSYFAYWSKQMRNVGKEDQITRQNCMDDFVVVHWAEEVKGTHG